MLMPKIVDDCFQMAIKIEEKLKRRQEKVARGRCSTSRGRGTSSTSRKPKEDHEDAKKNKEQVPKARGGWRGGRTIFRQIRDYGEFYGRCYRCNEFGHPSFKCPERFSVGASGSERKGDKRVQYVQGDEEESVSSPRRPADLEI